MSGQLIVEDEHYLLDSRYAPKLASVRRFLERTLWLLAEDEDNPTVFDGRGRDREAEIRRRVDAFFRVETMKARVILQCDALKSKALPSTDPKEDDPNRQLTPKQLVIPRPPISASQRLFLFTLRKI